MINGDIGDFWNEANQIDIEIQEGKNYLETGGEYRRPYLPSRTFYIFSSFFKKNLNTLSSSESLVLKRFFLLDFNSRDEISFSGVSKFSFEFLQYIIFVSGS